ncbi:MAG: LemA family protein [Firmicutes bacterium]|nr:LemA family protein [Bacillota bacterium]
MKKSLIVLGVIVLVIVLVVGSGISKYNSLVTMETAVDAAWAQVENQLQRRADLIPNLVATVKGYASHEERIFTEIADARSRLLAAGTTEEKIEASQNLESTLGRLLALSENYPQLKADASFIRLQDELAGTENRISVERMRYNTAVQNWNAQIKRFPTVIIANMFGKEVRPFFEAAPEAREVPKVEF